MGEAETLLDFQLALGFRTGPMIIPGIQPATQGLDDLLPCLQATAAAGARFDKWRALGLCNSLSLPTQADLEVQHKSFARSAVISQQAGLTIVGLDIEDADLKKSIEVHMRIISMYYARCTAYGVLLEGKSYFLALGEFGRGLSDLDAVKFLNAVDIVAD
ncbi:hypothetical protein DFJ58DRAFT_836980 [Suillus subalutaceus]|uniref:uncharacterized protein n=1 Tax=Suillus subalutaceus TaxID=48586 RepID=UPI001B86C5F7|nr:uncharacterized protein DFJ58DRAFT_836980 [Suillus subalutaceus]KAG1872429.1 hypothetical protein DFJ58DRAFT_836980 [Suillus subalutaceus]